MKIKKSIFAFLFLLLFCLSGSICFGSPQTYQISEEQLTILETSLIEQENLLSRLSSELSLLKLDSGEAKRQLVEANRQLERAKSELTESRSELQRLKKDLESSKVALAQANKLFREYEEAEKKTKKRLTRQRNLWIILLGSVAGGLAIAK